MRVDRPRARTFVAVLVCLSGSVWAQTDTGPSQQTTGFWAPYGNRINSVVAITNGFIGSGTIIDKRPDPNPNFGWLCVLTANHVVDPQDPSIVAGGGFTGPHTIHVGNNLNSALESFGGASNIVKYGQRPVAQGGLGGVDIAVLGVRVPVNSPAYTLLTPVSMVAVNPQQLVNDRARFSEIGFGGTGNFGPGGITRAAFDGEKRFQNNEIERFENVNDGYYNYQGIQWDMNKAAAPDPGGNHPLLVAEGISYGGDSGGPYMTTNSLFTSVSAFTRDGPNDPTNWPGGLMEFYSNSIMAVHTRGNTTRIVGNLDPYTNLAANPPTHTWGTGVPLTQARIDWIGQQCAMIPAPTTLGVLFAAGIVAIRRRRVAR
ncbi:MAG: hypothetical protein JNM80_09550 [Phycisphaerae bacterium]|nr:hypothetical protein [Phycisphaerae bacterium]